MARKFEVKQASVSAGAFVSTAPRQIRNGQTMTFNVYAYDDGVTPIELENPDQITEQDIYPLPELPIVNRTIFAWFDRTTYRCNPWLICSTKRVERDQQNKFLFRVVCEYSTPNTTELEEDDLKLIEIPETTDDYPFIVETIWTDEERAIFEERKDTNKQKMRLPTNNLFSEPFMSRFSRRMIRQHQFETFESFQTVNDTIKSRLFTLQDVAFQGDAAPADPPPPYPQWMITDIQYHKINLLAPGTDPDPPTVLPDTYLMTYIIERAGRDWGWLDRRALIDNHHVDANGDTVPWRSEVDGSTVLYTLIDKDGKRKTDQEGPPDYLYYQTQESGSWASFLKGTS